MELIKFDIQKFSGQFEAMNQGIDEAGIDQIYSQIHTWLDQNAKYALDNYLGFFNALDEGWVGSDKEVFKMLSAGKTDGVFQFESAGIRTVISVCPLRPFRASTRKFI